MTLSIYDVAVPMFTQGLTGLSWVLAKADAHFHDAGRDHAELVGDRLSADMFPFALQVAQSINHSKGALDRLTGRENSFAKPPETLTEARQMVAEALASVKAVTREDLAGAETRAINWDPMKNGGMNFDGGQAYLIGFAIPNYYFHSTTAYAIARKNGVPIGKRDFMGRGEPPANL